MTKMGPWKAMKKWIATCLASLYGMIVKFVQAGYQKVPARIRKVDARVISVGNITWGGTGKTPLVARLAKDLSDQGKKVAILTRGYSQDEVQELRRRLPDVPIVVGRDRIAKAREAIEKHKAEILILDDGFQHIRLHRDIDVVNINSTQPFGPGGLIPLGTLREPLENLSRADVFVLTKADIGSKNLHWIHQRLAQLKPGAHIFEAVHRPVQFMDFRKNKFLPLAEVRGKKVAALSAIGDPFSFEKTVENLDADIVLAARFDDHHVYTDAELLDFAKKCKTLGVKDVVTTEKDFYRIEPALKRRRRAEFLALSFLVLQIEFQLDDEEDFIRRCLNS